VSAADHASAVADIRAEGQPVTFRKVSPGVQDEATGLYSEPVVSTVPGWAIEVKPTEADFKLTGFEMGEIIQKQPATLLFAPETYGALPALHSSVAWAGKDRTVQGLLPLRPDGVAILARVVVA
jgi:hypothetical protein